MSYEYRSTVDYFFGTLLNAAAISDTELSAAAFTALDSDYSSGTPGKYLPLELHDPSQGIFEVVWVVGHAAGSQTVTVVRGREGTPPRAWNAGTQMVCAPTAGRDALAVLASTALPADAHIGHRVARTNKADVVERGAGVWGPSTGVAVASDVGPRRNGGSAPDGSVILMRGGHRTGTTGANGIITVSHPVAFPNATIATTVSIVTTGVPAVITIVAETASTISVAFYAISTGANVGSGVAVSFQYLSIGY
ncbi:gp53-like domain-containing protein [Amycolatopsis sp. CA-230715]|uniref:gp53-like domain-containing protein n=1 Tax=Amycolatopsis sp. CA-230715 TaxID=2745196 RepID=UPI001C026496|nr:hypothetical protein [Amycolatopsis sp. CA-230715]QWF78698.1 hypothetical protein HUW46_02096 [Amycolatopsis sp. CA-230715]